MIRANPCVQKNRHDHFMCCPCSSQKKTPTHHLHGVGGKQKRTRKNRMSSKDNYREQMCGAAWKFTWVYIKPPFWILHLHTSFSFVLKSTKEWLMDKSWRHMRVCLNESSDRKGITKAYILAKNVLTDLSRDPTSSKPWLA
jgi:hypothetical protein